MDGQSEPSFREKIQSIRNSLAQVQAESQLKECECLEKLGGLCGEVKMVLDAMEELEETKESGEEERPRKKRALDVGMSDDESADTDDGSVEFSGNPMLNDVVLGNLFRVCEFGDLRRFRLVSKRWYDVSLHRWRTTAVVNIVSNQTHEEFSGRHNRNYLSRSSSMNLLPDIPSASTQPFRNFKLHYFQFPGLGAERRPPVEECDGSVWKWESVEDSEPFWNSIGAWMHNLVLCEPIIENGKLLRDIIVEKAPNLQSLKITKDVGPSPESLPFENYDDQVHSKLECISIDYEGTTIPWNPLFKCFPNLKMIDCQLCVGQVGIFLDATNHLNLIKKEQLLDLRYVTLSSIPYYRHRENVAPEEAGSMEQLLSSKRLRFRDVFFVLDENIDETVVSDLFKSHSSTLQKLHFLQASYRPSYQYRLIDNKFSHLMPLTSLTKLAINSIGIVPNLHFLECTPNLRVLEFNDLDPRYLVEATDRARMEGVQLEKLEELTFTWSSCCISELEESDLGLIAALARNVKVFEGPLDNISFWTLCGCWPQMKKLIVHSPSEKFDDFGLTGKLADGSRMPNITSLKYLQEFRTGSPFLSDASIRNGFMQLEYLRRLRVTLSASTSDEAYLELWRRFRSIHVSRDEKRMPLERRLNDELKRQAEFLARDYAIY